ncbi:hypothetical protein BIW11_12651 [Tropilaelaps mercedesae]|uniref:Reverse transcriptase domain-containing protein n=1 Tax=Tropilaelaps mercedesae TaxID=418985 RepID=A0A1V9X607_9ACAR|nr:hypothetical protein BIW11_12651 [Tropilaelaps mercedesae]
MKPDGTGSRIGKCGMTWSFTATTDTSLSHSAHGTDTVQSAKKELARLIKKTKQQHWAKLIEDVENDSFGKAYKAVRSRLRGDGPLGILSEIGERPIACLFPTRVKELLSIPSESCKVEDPTVTIEEIITAGKRIKCNKAPGPDGIPPEAVKVMMKECSGCVKDVFGELLRQGRLSHDWKVGRLVLPSKERKPPEQPSSYRFLCLLPTVGKTYQAILSSRLTKELEEIGALSEC